MTRMAMTSPSPLCRQCWPGGLCPTSLTPALHLAGCLWKATPPQVSLQADLGLC